jgi:hypothetical protein
MSINLSEICDCCGGNANQPYLKLFDSKCFSIVEGKDTHEDFCLNDFTFPTDSYSCAGLTLKVDGGTTTLFDNNLQIMSPIGALESGDSYARGILLKVTYPTLDNNSEEIPIQDKKVVLTIESFDGSTTVDYPLYNFFSIFTNPKSNDPTQLINKIEVTNPNSNYSVRVSALVLFGNAI